MYDAIVLAGGESTGELRLHLDQPCKALIQFAGKPMVSYVTDALAASKQVDRLIVAGPAAALGSCSFPPGTRIVEGGSSIMETVQLAVAALGHNEKTIVAAADIPLLTADGVNDFLFRCSNIKADLHYPVVAEIDYEKTYPGSKRTFVRLRDGTFTGGNLFLVNPAIIPQCLTIAEKIVAHRKNPLRLCHIIGWLFVAEFIFGMITLEKAEKQVSELLAIEGAVVRSPYPEVGMDVDKLSDYERVKTVLSRDIN